MVIGPVSAATIIIQPSYSNSLIQSKINGANSGDTISFQPGTYTGISLKIIKGLSLTANGAVTLNGASTGPIFNVSNTVGVTINGFNMNSGAPSGSNIDDIDLTNVNSSSVTNNNFTNTLNNTNGIYMINVYNLNILNNRFSMYTNGLSSDRGTCIAGYSLFNTVINSNTLLKGSEGMNLYNQYQNLTVTNNHVSNIAGHYGDGISITNCAGAENATTSTVANNVINNVTEGIFIGGEFNGTVSSNNVTNTPIGMNITGKNQASQGSLNANILNNIVSGISMECPNVIYLNLTGNTVNQLGATGFSLNTTANKGTIYFAKNSAIPGYIYVTNNYFGYPVAQNFQDATDIANGNSGPGAYVKP